MTQPLEEKIDRIIGLVRCVGLAVDNQETQKYLRNPCHELIETIEEELKKYN